MILTYHGHAEFLLTSEAGFRLLTDPYDGSVGYPVRPVRADAVTVSHAHHDHAWIDKVEGSPCVKTDADRIALSPDTQVTGIPVFHDACGGQKRGSNLVFRIRMDGLSIVHMGDIGHTLADETAKEIGRPDILLIPVGGVYTIDAAAARETVDRLRPRVVIPMHFRDGEHGLRELAPVEAFLDCMGEKAERLPVLRVTLGDLSEQPRLVVMEAKP